MGGSRPADLGGNWPLGRVFVDLELQAHLRILMVGNRDDAMVDQQDSWDLHLYELDATVQTYGDLEHVSPPVDNTLNDLLFYDHDQDQAQGQSFIGGEGAYIHERSLGSTHVSPISNDAPQLLPVSAWTQSPSVSESLDPVDLGFYDSNFNVYRGPSSEPSNVASGVAGFSCPATPPLPPPNGAEVQTTEQSKVWGLPFLNSGTTSGLTDVVQNDHRPVPARSTSRPLGLPRKRSRYSLSRWRPRSTGSCTPISPNSQDPMRRWQESPPEDEPASLSAIMRAIDDSRDLSTDSVDQGSALESFRHHRRPASIASSRSGTSVSSWQSSVSTRSAISASWNSQSHAAGPKVNKGRGKARKPSGLDTERIFCCTFCCDTFKNKYDWSRHEKSLHLNLGGWACTPHGGTVWSAVTGRLRCVYCEMEDPTLEHLDRHNHFQCSNSTHLFRRKDHLVQHLRLVHALDTLPPLDDWKIPGPPITSRCGFCDHRMESWDERTDHLAAHFRQGMTMKDWHGEHDFAPEVAAKVINSLPPYLLSWESNTIVPFRASNKTAQDHLDQISARVNSIAAQNTSSQPAASSAAPAGDSKSPVGDEAMVPLETFTGILTQHLSRYARQQMSMGIIPTDEMFQQESRRLLYDSEDSWNQSIADNPAWISSFRRQLQVQSGPLSSANPDHLDMSIVNLGTTTDTEQAQNLP
ncbi:hypothetical protein PDE_06747 [Penicillium oxalicum 114-2]|uniref:C2H2-type domain-containing protein n=1 Tax=Penicillium oxalicum (strain 114-2 / CGMCC 5302) TaxID=933388 RepID=S7ZN84_PENO1|nr:hypothetical protein PDE_06747 [Penicillium oxalicum 114-2]